jgi:hypothetical protein
MADPVQEGIDIGYLVVFGVIAYIAYLAYQAVTDPTSSAGNWLCQNLGVNCPAGTTPPGGLGAVAASVGSWWGSLSETFSEDFTLGQTTVNQAINNAASTPAMVGSVLTTPPPPTPGAPTPGLPAGYNAATGTVQ